jgi:hypothetical protein
MLINTDTNTTALHYTPSILIHACILCCTHIQFPDYTTMTSGQKDDLLSHVKAHIAKLERTVQVFRANEG